MKLRPLTVLATAILLLVAAAGCTPRTSRERLRRAEAIIETDAAAAAAVLDSLDVASLQGRDLADYAWLRVQADYKAYVPLTTDSLARLATDYYGTPRRKRYPAAMAWYTLGCCYTDMNDDPAAISAYLKAKECFPDTTIRYYALAEQKLGDLYLKRIMCAEAASELRCSRQHLVALADSTTLAYVDYRLALCHLYRQHYALADSLLVVAAANPHAHASLRRDVLFQRAKIAYAEGRNEEARQLLISNMSLTPNKTVLCGSYELYADILCDEQQYDSAYQYYQQSVRGQSAPNTMTLSYGRLAELAAITGRTDSVRHYQRLHDMWADSVYKIKNQQDVNAVVAAHTVAMNELQAKAEKERRTLLMLMALLVLLLVLFLAVRRYRARKEQEIQTLKALLQQRSIQLNHLSTSPDEEAAAPPADEPQASAAESASAEPEALPLTEAQIAEAVPLLLEMLELSADLLRKTYRRDLRTIVTLNDHEQNAFRQQYVEAVDACFADFFSHLHAYAPALNPQEMRYIVGQYMGVDSKTLRCLQGTEPSAFRMRRMRIHQKLPPVLLQALLPDGKAELQQSDASQVASHTTE